jgi:hypothetical protein
MRTYRISPSLLNSFSDWLNADELYEKFWGNSASPSVSIEDFEKKQLGELLDYINHEPQEPNEAADRGTSLNEIVDCLIGATPNPCTCTWEKREGLYVANRNCFEFIFDGNLVEDLARMFRTALPQYHLAAKYMVSDFMVELHGYADYILPTQIYDLKTTGRYEGEKYAGNWQRHVYPLIAVDGMSMTRCDAFRFLAVECKQGRDGVIGGKVWTETYDFNIEESRAKVMSFIRYQVVPQLDIWQQKGLIKNQTIITE